MKIRASLKSFMKKGKLIRRGKRLLIIDPKNPRIKIRQGKK